MNNQNYVYYNNCCSFYDPELLNIDTIKPSISMFIGQNYNTYDDDIMVVIKNNYNDDI